jgi:hypothetical protein
VLEPVDYYVIPNNNMKYYVYVTKKNSTENFDILYFFPDEHAVVSFVDDKAKAFTISDFYTETNHIFQNSLLLEGYLYTNLASTEHTFLLTDILVKNGKIVSCDYGLRHALLNELVMDKNLRRINNHLTIGVHPVFHSESENMVKIFQDNFIFKDAFCSIEKVQQFAKTRLHMTPTVSTVTCDKLIEKGGFTDVYKVVDAESGDNHGILYVKSLAHSKSLKEMFQTNPDVPKKCRCKYNHTFQKWEPIFVVEN